MKMKKILGTVIVAGLALGCFTACESEKEHGGKENLAAEAKITKAQAQQIAMAKVPNGTIKEGELEKEKGRLIWSFDIATPGTSDITEVAVDAITGDIASIDKESASDEAKEKAKEKDDDDKK